MLLTWIDRFGNWNPQLIRELKGRIRPRNILLAIALSVIAQMALAAMFYNELPLNNTYSRYCTIDPQTYNCIKDALGNVVIDWEHWWVDFFRALNWCFPFALMVPGVYMLVTDIDQEERRGTLNFIRLSPQSSHSVLLGKLLGTPILVYLGVGLAIPFHAFVGSAAGASVGFLLSYYLLLLAGCGLIYSAALLLGFLGKLQPGLGGTQVGAGLALSSTAFTVFIFVPLFLVWNAHTTWSASIDYIIGGGYPSSADLNWFGLGLGNNPIPAHAFILFNLGVGVYWIWHALQRCFHSPSATMFSKKQSYGLIAYAEVILLGFYLYDRQHFENWAYSDNLMMTVLSLSAIHVIGFLLLIALLTNHRQTLLDWARYRHVHVADDRLLEGAARHSSRRRSIVWDLIWGEKSPVMGAIAINLLLASVTLLPILFTFKPQDWLYIFLGAVIVVNLIALYAVIVQLSLLMKTPKRGFWALGMVGTVLLVPTITAAFLSSSANFPSQWFLLTPLPWLVLEKGITLSLVLPTIAGQWLAIVLLNLKLIRQLKRAGESASKRLLMAN